MFSILHISDLHRSRRYPITNDELISALMRDRERYVHEDPPVRAPDAIVVSGDLIQGVPLRTSDCATKLGEQYAVAEDFLNQLVQRFVNGDRSRIIIVPGNHDVDWNTARQAMALVCVEDAPTDIPEELLRESSSYRWNWRTRELYQIVDEQLYAKRLDAFWDFFNRFYAKVPGLLRVQRGADANLFSLCGDHIAVVAF